MSEEATMTVTDGAGSSSETLEDASPEHHGQTNGQTDGPVEDMRVNGSGDEEQTSAPNPIGERLRNIRQQQGMSLADVQTKSNGRWKSVVVGAYERGDRTVSIARLAELARFYGVPLVDILPDTTPRKAVSDAVEDGDAGLPDPSGPVRLDLTRLQHPRSTETAAVARFARQVQRWRGDHNGKVLTLRGGDLSTIAIAIGREDMVVLERLRDEGALFAIAA